jgi:hypothetical protein
MGTRKIPERLFWVCDLCGNELENKATIARRPAHWAELTLQRDSFCYSDKLVPPFFLALLTCEACFTKVTTKLEEMGIARLPRQS